MVYLIGGLLAVVLLYFWLMGHWFARVVMFLALIPVGTAGIAAGLSAAGDQMQNGLAFCLVVGAIASWFASGIPAYVRRSNSRWAILNTNARIEFNPEA